MSRSGLSYRNTNRYDIVTSPKPASGGRAAKAARYKFGDAAYITFKKQWTLFHPYKKTISMDSIQSQHEFEKKIFDLVMDYYEGMLPQTIYLAINRKDLSLALITSAKSASGLAGQQGWVIASIPTENFNDNVA